MKRGALEVGINTIVILVIAIVLLGLAIGFVRNIFEGASKLPTLISTDGFEIPPTVDAPIRLTPSKIEVKSGDTVPVKVGIYNTLAVADDFAPAITSCTGGGVPDLLSLAAEIQPSSSQGFEVFITANDANTGDRLSPGNYICNMAGQLSVEDPGGAGPIPITNPSKDFSHSTQFTLTVVS